MTFNHAGFAVDDLEQAILVYEALGFKLVRRFEKPEPRAQVASLKDSNGAGIELWQFAGDHPLRGYIGHHIAFKSDNAQRDAVTLEQQGFQIVIPFTEGVILNYIFVQNKDGLVYELAEDK